MCILTYRTILYLLVGLEKNKWLSPKCFQIIIIISGNKILNMVDECKGSWLLLHKTFNSVLVSMSTGIQ